MMLKPAITDILKENESYYSLVVAVAKRARTIADQANEEKEILIEKPVQISVEQFADGTCKLIERDNIGETIE